MRQLTNTFDVQCRVIMALMLRETKTLYGHSKLGYLWAAIEPMLLIGTFWAILIGVGRDRTLPFGISLPVFLLSGVGPWLLFSSVLSKLMQSIKGNMSLLGYPQVTPLDIIISRAILDGVTNFAACLVLLGIMKFFGFFTKFQSLSLVLQGTFLAWWLGVSLGILCTAASIMRPSVERAINIVLRFLFFASSVFFSIDMLPFVVRQVLLYNPLLHAVELTRSGFCSSYSHDNYISIYYPLSWCLVMLFLGLSMERSMRAKIERL